MLLNTLTSGYFSIRDIYTDNAGSMCIRLENQEGRALVKFECDEIRTLIEGIKENQRLQPLEKKA